jgi:hypothetical protein
VARKDQIKSIEGITRIPIFISQVEGFNEYFQVQLRNVVERLATSGVNVARRTIREAKTEWGKSRMAGNHYGVRFAPYGRSEGREDTGFMYDSLTSSVRKDGNTWRGVWGWPDSAIRKAGYIPLQEFGFYASGKFDPVATAASGKAKFQAVQGGRGKWIPGAYSMFASRDSIGKRIESAFSQAWNQARVDFKAAGNSSDPGSYLENRAKEYSRRASRGIRGF